MGVGRPARKRRKPVLLALVVAAVAMVAGGTRANATPAVEPAHPAGVVDDRPPARPASGGHVAPSEPELLDRSAVPDDPDHIPSHELSRPTQALDAHIAPDDADHPHSHGFHDERPQPEGEPGEKVMSFAIDELVVTASPLPRTASQLARAVSVLEGKELLQDQQPTIGQTVAGLPGVSATWYGPGASRPVVRGLSGPRVLGLENTLSTLDVASASDDHAVSLDPLAVTEVEILRGPASLRFGPGAVGGIVNTIDGRLPTRPAEAAFGGSVQARGASVNGSFSGAAVLDGGAGPLAWHLSGSGMTSGDTQIPGYARSAELRQREPLPPGEKEPYGTLPNSAVETNGFSAGLAWVGDGFHLGAAPSLFQSDYGVVAEPNVTIDLTQKRLDLGGAIEDPLAFLHELALDARLVDYVHTELEGDEVGTRFNNRGYDLRVEALHERLGLIEGAAGFQSLRSDLAALGEEAFLPPSVAQAEGLFVIEEVDLSPLSVELGGRLDGTRVDSSGGEVFGPPVERSLVTGNIALGLLWDAPAEQNLALYLSWMQRPPNAEELYAHGPHIALDRFEIGDPNLGSEDSLGISVGEIGNFGPIDWSLSAFYTDFSRFLTLFPNGQIEDGLPVEVFAAVPARFAGGEAELAWHVFDDAESALHFAGRVDGVHARQTDTGEPLPRIPPARLGATVTWERGPAQVELDMLHAFAQDDVPPGVLPTAGYTMLDLELSWEFEAIGPVKPLLFFAIMNLLDAEARDAASFLKDIAPLPGRNFTGGVQMTF